MGKTLTGDTLVVASKEQISADLQGEAAILNLSRGVYFGLNDVGARIWALLQEPMTVRALGDVLIEEYEVEEDRCRSDLMNLLDELAQHGLIEVKDGKAR